MNLCKNLNHILCTQSTSTRSQYLTLEYHHIEFIQPLLPTMMPSVKNSSSNSDKYQPAYKGATFDNSGYCLKHPMIRLCKPAPNGNSESRSLLSNNEEGEKLKPQYKFIIIRKICPMCGEHSLRNERKFNKSVSHMTVLVMIAPYGLTFLT